MSHNNVFKNLYKSDFNHANGKSESDTSDIVKMTGTNYKLLDEEAADIIARADKILGIKVQAGNDENVVLGLSTGAGMSSQLDNDKMKQAVMTSNDTAHLISQNNKNEIPQSNKEEETFYDNPVASKKHHLSRLQLVKEDEATAKFDAYHLDNEKKYQASLNMALNETDAKLDLNSIDKMPQNEHEKATIHNDRNSSKTSEAIVNKGQTATTKYNRFWLLPPPKEDDPIVYIGTNLEDGKHQVDPNMTTLIETDPMLDPNKIHSMSMNVDEQAAMNNDHKASKMSEVTANNGQTANTKHGRVWLLPPPKKDDLTVYIDANLEDGKHQVDPNMTTLIETDPMLDPNKIYSMSMNVDEQATMNDDHEVSKMSEVTANNGQTANTKHRRFWLLPPPKDDDPIVCIDSSLEDRKHQVDPNMTTLIESDPMIDQNKMHLMPKNEAQQAVTSEDQHDSKMREVSANDAQKATTKHTRLRLLPPEDDHLTVKLDNNFGNGEFKVDIDMLKRHDTDLMPDQSNTNEIQWNWDKEAVMYDPPEASNVRMTIANNNGQSAATKRYKSWVLTMKGGAPVVYDDDEEDDEDDFSDHFQFGEEKFGPQVPENAPNSSLEEIADDNTDKVCHITIFFFVTAGGVNEYKVLSSQFNIYG
jgi:hypothetical protein